MEIFSYINIGNIQDLSPMKQKNLTVQNENGDNVAFTFSPEKSRVDTENIEGGSDKNQEEGEMIFKEEEEQPEAIPVVNEAEVTQSEETASPGFENENAIGEKGLESAQQQQEETVVEENNEKKAEEIQQQEQEGENVVVAPVESQ